MRKTSVHRLWTLIDAVYATVLTLFQIFFLMFYLDSIGLGVDLPKGPHVLTL